MYYRICCCIKGGIREECAWGLVLERVRKSLVSATNCNREKKSKNKVKRTIVKYTSPMLCISRRLKKMKLGSDLICGWEADYPKSPQCKSFVFCWSIWFEQCERQRTRWRSNKYHYIHYSSLRDLYTYFRDEFGIWSCKFLHCFQTFAATYVLAQIVMTVGCKNIQRRSPWRRQTTIPLQVFARDYKAT